VDLEPEQVLALDSVAKVEVALELGVEQALRLNLVVKMAPKPETEQAMDLAMAPKLELTAEALTTWVQTQALAET
jgi:hypothetical protein